MNARVQQETIPSGRRSASVPVARTKRANGDTAITFDDIRKRYVARITVGFDLDGKQVRKRFVGKTRAEVKRRIDAARAALEHGRPAPDDNLTVNQFLARWCRRLPGTVSEGTQDTYTRYCRLYISPHLGNVCLTQLTPTNVADWLDSLEAQGLAPATRRGVRAVLRRALRRAEQEGLVARNVAAIADGPRSAQTEGRYLTEHEALTLVDALRTEPAREPHDRGRPPTNHRRLATAVLVQLALGLRPGETLGLQWGNVKLDDPPTVELVRQIQRRPNGGGLALVELKTRRSRRTIVVPDFVVDALRSHRAAQNAQRLALSVHWDDRYDLVFTTDVGGPVEPRTYAKFLSDTCVRAGLGHRNPHALRHSAATILLAEGVPIEVVSDILGHSSIRVTKDVYGHLVVRQQVDAAKAMNRALSPGTP